MQHPHHPTHRPRLSLLAASLLLACAQAHAGDATSAAHADASTTPVASSADAKTLGQVLVVAQRAERSSSGATHLDLTIKDTPQSISDITSQQMDNFDAHSVNDALRLATGVQVDEWETNRTSYSARGFDILNTQIDGTGLPNNWGVTTGAMDSYGYEKVEVIRGANGLLTGVGNAAGTINYVRKRPTNQRQGSFGVSYGSWGTTRVQADYSTPLTDDRRWAGRVVAAREDGGLCLPESVKWEWRAMCGTPTRRSVRARVGARAAAHRPRAVARTVERA